MAKKDVFRRTFNTLQDITINTQGVISVERKTVDTMYMYRKRNKENVRRIQESAT